MGQPRSWVNDRPPKRFFRSGVTRPGPHGRTSDTARPEPAATRPYRSDQAHALSGRRVDGHIEVRSETRQAPSNSNSCCGRGRAAAMGGARDGNPTPSRYFQVSHDGAGGSDGGNDLHAAPTGGTFGHVNGPHLADRPPQPVPALGGGRLTLTNARNRRRQRRPFLQQLFGGHYKADTHRPTKRTSARRPPARPPHATNRPPAAVA